MPELQTFHDLDDAFPGEQHGRVVALRADDTPQTQAAIDDLIAAALASGEMQEPMDVTRSDDGSVYQSTSRSPGAARTRSPTTP